MNGFLNGPNGDKSSKRLVGFICLVMACITGIIAMFTDKGLLIPGMFLTTTTTIFITQAITKT